jgi:C-terminal processing protease CtpA/Prc
MDRLWHARALATPYSAHLSEAERIAGLSLFWSEAKYNFAHFNNVPQLDWDKAYLDFLPKVIAAPDTAAYYDVLMRFAPLLHDGHTNIYPPSELQGHFYARPPMRTALVGGKVLVTFVGSAQLERQGVHVGDEITAIDGIDVKRYAREHVAPYESSSTVQDMAVRMFTYGLLAGDKDVPLKLALDHGRGSRRTVTVARDGYPDRHAPPAFVFRELPGGVVYLSIDQFETKASSEAFMQHLPQIMRAKGLILDVRKNGGGSDSYGFEILSHLTKAPIPGPRATELSVSSVARANGHLSLEWRQLGGSGATYPHKTMPIFTGPVALLTSARTFSAAEDFVMAFDALKRGMLVGQTTGGSTGMPLSFGLPGGGSARICAKWDSYPDGREFVGIGIAPDIAVSPTVADIRAGRDPVIERAAAALRATAKKRVPRG